MKKVEYVFLWVYVGLVYFFFCCELFIMIFGDFCGFGECGGDFFGVFGWVFWLILWFICWVDMNYIVFLNVVFVEDFSDLVCFFDG